MAIPDWQPKHIGHARNLRRNSTDVKRALWNRLRNRSAGGREFRRQYAIGSYVVDFVCLEEKLVVELDGGQHGENIDYDSRRTRWLEAEGFQVVRFWNNEVLENIDGIVQTIMSEFSCEGPYPGPLPQAGEGVKLR